MLISLFVITIKSEELINLSENNMQLKRTIFLIILFVLANFTGLISSDDNNADKIRIFTAVPPLAYLIQQIGADLVETEILIEPGKSPHTFEPTSRQMMSLSQSDIYVTSGLPFEKQLYERITKMNKNLHVIFTEDGIKRISKTSSCQHLDEHSQKHELDPHIWLAPSSIKIILKNILSGLSEYDKTHKQIYEDNTERFLAELDKTDTEIRTSLEPFEGSSFYVYHPAFGYFAEAYGLNQIAVEIEGKLPSPRQIQSLIQKAKQENVKMIFVQPQFDKKSAETIASAISGVVIEIDPLSENILANLQNIARSLKSAFEKQSRSQER